MNCDITLPEVSEAIDRLPDGKSYLEIPGEALKCIEAKILLQKFFSRCFQLGLSPYDWDKSDIIPIPKPDKDSRLPLNHRPITIMCVIAKLYAGILNRRLQSYLEDNNILSDEQNGFRAGRSCIDHIFTLMTILRNRKSMNKSTFICYIDFRRAFDSVDRQLLLFSLSKIGIVGQMYFTLKALYNDPKSRIVMDGF